MWRPNISPKMSFEFINNNLQAKIWNLQCHWNGKMAQKSDLVKTLHLEVLLTSGQRIWTAFWLTISGIPQLTIFGALNYMLKNNRAENTHLTANPKDTSYQLAWQLCSGLNPCLQQSPKFLFQLRYLQTLSTISAEHNSTIIFPMPINIFRCKTHIYI